LVDEFQSIGCSLKIHRVESVLSVESMGQKNLMRRATGNKFDCVK
jgi:hypothetical protein